MKAIWCALFYICVTWANISFAFPKKEVGTFPEEENVFSSDFSATGGRLPTAQDAHKWIAIKSTSIHLSWSDRFSIAINKAVTAYSVFLNLPQSSEKAASAIIHDTNYMNYKLSGLKASTKYTGELQALVGPHKWPYKLLNFTVTTSTLLNGLEAAVHPKVFATSDISDLEDVSVDVQLRWTETPYKTDGIPPSEYLLKLWQKDQVLREELIEGNSHRIEFMETIIGGLSLDRLYKVTLEGRNSKGNSGITLAFSLVTGSLFASESVFMTGGVAGCFSALQVRCPYSDRCVSPYWICDGSKDCPEGEDEDGCDEVEPCQNGFRCWGSNKCLPASWRCDGYEDCLDGDDELGCNNCAGEDLLRCGTGSDCVSIGYACDGQKQCPDGWDETDAICNHVIPNFELGTLSKSFECPSEKVSCGRSGGCVTRTSLCDDVQDCPNGEDENVLFCQGFRNCTNNAFEGSQEMHNKLLGNEDSEIILNTQQSTSSDNLLKIIIKTTDAAMEQLTTIVQTPKTQESVDVILTATSTPPSPSSSLSPASLSALSFVAQTNESYVSLSQSSAAFTTLKASTTPLSILSTTETFIPTTTQSTSQTFTESLKMVPTLATQASYNLIADSKIKLNDKIATTKSSNKVVVTSKCRPDEFDCGDGWCVPVFWLCDGRFDCLDGADEDPKICETIVEGVDHSIEENYIEEVPFEIKCTFDQLQCSTGQCIDKAKICNGVNDCPGKEDEYSCVAPTDSPTKIVPLMTESVVGTHLENHKSPITFLDGNEISTILDYENQSFSSNTVFDHVNGSASTEASEGSRSSIFETSAAPTEITITSNDSTSPTNANYMKPEVILFMDDSITENNTLKMSSETKSTNISSADFHINQLPAINVTAMEEENNLIEEWSNETDNSTKFPIKELVINFTRQYDPLLNRDNISLNMTTSRSETSSTDNDHVVIKDGTDYYFHSYVDYDSSESWLSYDSNFDMDNDTTLNINVRSDSKDDTNSDHDTIYDYHNRHDTINSTYNDSTLITQGLNKENANISFIDNNASDEVVEATFNLNLKTGDLPLNSSVKFNESINNETELEDLTSLDSNNVTFKISGTTSEDGFLVLSTSSTENVAHGNSTVLIAIHAESVNGRTPEFVIHNTNGTQYNFDVITVINKPLKRAKIDAVKSKAPKSKYILEKVITFRLESNGKLQYNPVILNSPYDDPQPMNSDKNSLQEENQKYRNISCEAKNETKIKESPIYFINQIKPVHLNLSTTISTNRQINTLLNDSHDREETNVNIISIIPSNNISSINTFSTLRLAKTDTLPNNGEEVTSSDIEESVTSRIFDLTKYESEPPMVELNNFTTFPESTTEFFDNENNFKYVAASNASSASSVISNNLLSIQNISSSTILDDSHVHLLTSTLNSDTISTESYTATAVTDSSSTTNKELLVEKTDSSLPDDYEYPDEWLEQKEHFDGVKFSQDLPNFIGSSSRDPDYVLRGTTNERPETVKSSSEDLYSMESDNRDDANYLSNNIHDNHYYDLDYEMKNDLDRFGRFEDSNSIEPIHAEQINRDYVQYPAESSSTSLLNQNIPHSFTCFFPLLLLLLV